MQIYIVKIQLRPRSLHILNYELIKRNVMSKFHHFKSKNAIMKSCLEQKKQAD